MPSYKTHVKINLSFFLPLALLTLKGLGVGGNEMFLFSGAFIYSTYFLHPDLDLAKKMSPFSVRGLLSLPFLPYSFLFRHRGISHMPLVGTATRVLWLCGVIWGICTLCGWAFPAVHKPSLPFLLSGFAIADLGHEILDQVEQRRRK